MIPGLEPTPPVADVVSASSGRLRSLPLASVLALPPYSVGVHSVSWFKPKRLMVG